MKILENRNFYIMFNQNDNAVYFTDVYKLLSKTNKKLFNDLFNEAKNNCKNQVLKIFFDSIKIENNELKIDNFNKELYDIFINNLKIEQKKW